MELYKQKVVKDGVSYTDLYCIWLHEGKQYKVRVKQVFDKDFKLLCSEAKELVD